MKKSIQQDLGLEMQQLKKRVTVLERAVQDSIMTADDARAIREGETDRKEGKLISEGTVKKKFGYS